MYPGAVAGGAGGMPYGTMVAVQQGPYGYTPIPMRPGQVCLCVLRRRLLHTADAMSVRGRGQGGSGGGVDVHARLRSGDG